MVSSTLETSNLGTLLFGKPFAYCDPKKVTIDVRCTSSWRSKLDGSKNLKTVSHMVQTGKMDFFKALDNRKRVQ